MTKGNWSFPQLTLRLAPSQLDINNPSGEKKTKKHPPKSSVDVAVVSFLALGCGLNSPLHSFVLLPSMTNLGLQGTGTFYRSRHRIGSSSSQPRRALL
ncbi:hypothetical protein TNCT_673321 [Trichonephila clavata]|uniref:Uncharacterized protein n=1 Tax=Trichonephila clavata TaxID=2740835 RepID=A0A8X6FIF1_TRICU|nr:hypothetical protein TNCT_673321 [Trichonephila clavata]